MEIPSPRTTERNPGDTAQSAASYRKLHDHLLVDAKISVDMSSYRDPMHFSGSSAAIMCLLLRLFVMSCYLRDSPFTSPSSTRPGPWLQRVRVLTPYAKPEEATESMEVERVLLMCHKSTI